MIQKVESEFTVSPAFTKLTLAYDREDLCVQVVNKTLIEGAVVNV